MTKKKTTKKKIAKKKPGKSPTKNKKIKSLSKTSSQIPGPTTTKPIQNIEPPKNTCFFKNFKNRILRVLGFGLYD